MPRTHKHRLAAVAALAATVGLGAWVAIEVPARAIDRFTRQTFDCLDPIDEYGKGDPADCRQSEAMLRLARTLPWTRDETLQAQANIEAVVLERQLRVASIRDFDVALRDRAGRALVELHHGEYPPRGPTEPLAQLAFAGAHELVVELATPQETTHDRHLAMRVALLLGDWEAASRIAESSAADHFYFALEAMIVACILGDRQTATMRHAELDVMYPDAQWGMLLVEQHCNLSSAREPQDDATKTALRRVASLYEPGAIIARESSPNRHDELGMTVARLALAQTDPIEWSRDSAIELIDRVGLDDPDGLTVVLMRTRDELTGAGGPVIIAEIEAGARRLAELAATAPIELELEPGGRHLRPRRSLLWGGFCLASMAATERLWRGQLAEARAIYWVARELAANDEFRELAPLAELPLLGLHDWLDPQEALRVARSISDENIASTEPIVQEILRLQLALIFERAGELDRAVELSAGAFELLDGQQPDVMRTGLGFELAARWVHGALLFRTGRETSLELEMPAELSGGALLDGGAVFAYWWNAAQADPAAQVEHRWRSDGHSRLYLPIEPWSLASALEVLARSGPSDQRELWLDVVSSDIQADPLTLLRGRLSAAERLGDADAVGRWREREAALVEKLRDDRAAALYRLIGRR